jgi:hypothetical protein
VTSIAAPVIHRPEQREGFFTHGGTGNYYFNCTEHPPHPPHTKWRRLRVSLEWMGGQPVLGSDSVTSIAINWKKHDGTSTYNHWGSVASGTVQTIIPNAGIGALEIVTQSMHGQDPAVGWWNGLIKGFYNVGGTSPEHMGGDYWTFTGRFVWKGPLLRMGVTGGTSWSIHSIADWVV